jgi:hypothetical protein
MPALQSQRSGQLQLPWQGWANAAAQSGRSSGGLSSNDKERQAQVFSLERQLTASSLLAELPRRSAVFFWGW